MEGWLYSVLDHGRELWTNICEISSVVVPSGPPTGVFVA